MSSAVFNDIQYKASAGQVNLDQAQGIVECFVAGIGNKDSVGDVCATGAFTKSLMRRKPRVVWGHNWNDPIGKVLEIYEVAPSDPRLPGKMRSAGIGGLYAKVQFNLNSEKGREAFANVAFFGEEQEWSIGYKTLRAQFDQGSQANILYEVELYEVSPVLHGANQLTGTISVKSDEKGGMIPMMTSPMGMPDTYGQPKPGSDIERKLEEELSVRLGTPVKILKMEDGVVHFSRDGEQGEPSDYKCRYHMGDDGVFMFGRPERYESPVAKPVQRMPMGMPSKPMTTQNPFVPVVVPSAVPGASPSSPPMVRFNYQGTGAPTPGTNPKVVDEERDLAEALIRITKRYGKFNEDSTGVWAGYKSPAENPVAKIGVKCANCILYEGEGKCKIIAMAVEPEGKCRFAVIPDGVVTMGPIQKMNYDMEREEEEVKWLEEIEAKHPREFLDGSARIALRRNWVKREESKSLFRIDEYSEKSLNSAPDAGYVLPVSPEKAFEVKQLLDPIISYHMVDSYVEDGGIVFTNGVTKEFIEAVSEAASPVFFQQEKALGRSVSGKIRNSSRGLTARFNPKAWDGDNDGLVQEGTAFERPAVPGVNDYASRGRVDTRRATEAFEAQQQGQAAKKPAARGLSSGGEQSDGASKKLDDILKDMDDRWDTDSSREKFGEYLDTLDPDELEDARSNIAAQMRKDQASARNDGLLSEDVINNDFDSLVESLKSEYEMDAVEAENEAGRMLEAADAYVARRENYLAADEDIARRLKGPKPKKSKEGLSSGGEWTKTQDGYEMDAPDIEGVYDVYKTDDGKFIVTRYSDAARNGGQDTQEYEHDKEFSTLAAAKKWVEKDYAEAANEYGLEDDDEDDGGGLSSGGEWTKNADGYEMDAPDIEGVYDVYKTDDGKFIVTRYSDYNRNGGQDAQEYEHDKEFSTLAAAKKWVEKDYAEAANEYGLEDEDDEDGGGLSSGAKPSGEASDKEIFDFRMDGNSLDEAAEKFNMTREKVRAAEMRRASELRKSGSGLSSGSRRDNRKRKISKFRESSEYLGDVDEVLDRFEDRGVTGGIDSLLAKEDIEWPGFDAEEEELEAYREAREKMLEERGIRPLGEELRDGFFEDLGNGPSDSKQYIKDLPGYGNRLFLHRGNYEKMTTDFARNPDGKFGKDANLGDGWYMEKLVFDDYEGMYSDEPDFDTAGVVGPFNSEDEAIDWWMENGDNEDNPSGLSSGAGADDMPNYENSKKLADLISQSPKPERSDYDYTQDGGNTPTEEQKDVIDAVMEGADVVVGALAGSGKTSTLVSLARRLKREKPGSKKTYVAFNKTAARDARRRFRDTGTAVRTLDSVTYGWYRSQGKEQAAHVKARYELNDGATGTPNRPKDITRKFKVKGLVIDGNNVDADDVSRIAKQAVDMYELSADETLLPSHFSFKDVAIDDVPQELMSLANAIWQSRTDAKDSDGMQFSNNTMTKLFALANPSFSGGEAIPGQNIELMLFDESQDLNPVWSGLIQKQDVQKVIVGDPNQAIYSFRGAKNEMDVLAGNTEYTLPLTDVFRFNDKIAGPGNRVLRLFGIMFGRMYGRGGGKGEVVEANSMTDAGMILARTNAGVIKAILRELDNPTTAKPRVVGTTARAYAELESFIDSWKYIIGGGSQGTARRPKKMHKELEEYDNINEIQDAINKGTASQKTKTLFNLGLEHSVNDLERVLGNIEIWTPGEDGEDYGFDLPDSFESGDIGTFGDAEYEITENKIIFSGETFPIKDYIKRSGGGWDGTSWSFSASTPEEREKFFSNLLDVLDNGASGASIEDYDFGDTSPGSSGNFGDIKYGKKGEVKKPTTFTVAGSGVTLNNLPFIKTGDAVDKRLRDIGFTPKQVNGVWGRVLPTRGMSEDEIKESLQAAYRAVKLGSDGDLKPYSQISPEGEIDEIIKAAEDKLAQGKVPDNKIKGLQYALDTYKRLGYLRNSEWDKIEKQAGMKRPKKAIDVKILTAHLAKGLEDDNVQLWNDFWGPVRNSKTGKYDWPDQEHMNVIYVALTRARKKLDMGSAAWILDYTSEEDELPNAPGEREGLSSGRAKRTVGEVAKRKPFTEEERQAFRDGVRTRAQTISGKRRGSAPGDMDGVRGNSNNRARRRGLSSGRKLTPDEQRILKEEEAARLPRGDAGRAGGGGGGGGFNPYGGTDFGDEEDSTNKRRGTSASAIVSAKETGWGTFNKDDEFSLSEAAKRRLGPGRFDLSLGSMAFNEGRRPGDPWMLRASKLRAIFRVKKPATKNEDAKIVQLSDKQIASILGITESYLQKWDDPDAGIPEIVVTELLEARDDSISMAQTMFGGYEEGSPGSQIRKIWGFRAAPAWIDKLTKARVSKEEFDFAKENNEKEFFEGSILPELELDIPVDLSSSPDYSGLENEISEEIDRMIASAQAKKTLAEAIDKKNFSIALLGRYLGILDEGGLASKKKAGGKDKANDKADEGNYPQFAKALKALGWPLEEVTYNSWLKDGIPSNKADQLVDLIRDAGYPEASISGIFGADLAIIDELPLKFIARERMEKILTEQGLSEDVIKNIFSYAFSEIDPKNGKLKRNTNSYGDFLSYQKSKREKKAAGEVYSPPGKAFERFTDEELDRATAYINDKLAKNGKPELTKEQIFQIKKVDTRGMKIRGVTAVNKEILEGLGVSTEKLESQDETVKRELQEFTGPKEVVQFMPGGPQKIGLANIARMSSAELLESINEHEKWIEDNDLGEQYVKKDSNIYYRQIDRLRARLDTINEVMSNPDAYRKPKQMDGSESDAEFAARVARRNEDADAIEAMERRSSGLSSGAGPSRKTPSAKDVSDFVSLATQRGKASGALSDSDLTPPIYMVNDETKNAHFTDIGQRQFSRLKNALRAREVLADMFSEIADNPNMTVDDLGNTDIDKPQQAIDSIKRLDGYIDSIVDQMNKIEIQARREQEEMKKMEKSQKRVFEMLDSLTSGREDPTDAELELEQDLEMTLRGLDGGMKDSQSALDNQYGPLLEMRKRMLEAVSSSQGFSRNRKKIRTKGANALSIKQLVNVQ